MRSTCYNLCCLQPWPLPRRYSFLLSLWSPLVTARVRALRMFLLFSVWNYSFQYCILKPCVTEEFLRLPQISPALPVFLCIIPTLALNSLLPAPPCSPCALLFLRQWNTGVYPQETLNASSVCVFSVSQLHHSVEFSVSHMERLNMCFRSWELIPHHNRRCRCPCLSCMGSAFPALSLHAAALGFIGAERTRR